MLNHILMKFLVIVTDTSENNIRSLKVEHEVTHVQSYNINVSWGFRQSLSSFLIFEMNLLGVC